MTEKNKTVLVVDDEEDTLEYLATLIADNGYTVVTAKDGAQGMAAVRSAPPDLITLDVTMPEKSGVRMYRDLKEDEALKTIPVIIVTGISQDFERFISTRRQVPPPEAYCAKPIEREELLKEIRRLTG